MIVIIGDGFLLIIILIKKYPAITSTNTFMTSKLNDIEKLPSLYLIGNKTSLNRIIAEEVMRATATVLIPPRVA